MQLRQNVDYGYLQGTFPSKTKRFENLGALSLSPQDNGTAAGCESNRLFLVSPRRMEIIDIQPITTFRLRQIWHSTSRNSLVINSFHSTAQPA